MTSWNIKEIITLIKNCGITALKYYENPLPSIKADHSIVTAADNTVEDRLAEFFNHPENGSFMIGEETITTQNEVYIQKALSGTTWIVDPIDGTAAYANHLPTWGISIALMKKGIIEEGAVFLPAFGELFITEREKVFHCVKSGIISDWDFSNLKEIIPYKRQYSESGMISLSQIISKHGRFKGYNPVQTIASSVYSLVNLAKGSYIAYFSAAKLWDIAAGLTIIKKLGFEARLLSGMELSLTVNNKLYNLESKSPERWKTKEPVIYAPDIKIVDYIKKNVTI